MLADSAWPAAHPPQCLQRCIHHLSPTPSPDRSPPPPLLLLSLSHQLEARGGSGEELLRLCAVLRLSQVSERADKRAGRGIEDCLDVLPALERVVQVSWVHVQVSEDAESEGVRVGVIVRHRPRRGRAERRARREAH
eukprot:scaffold50408_cov28-Tisochrysis_lutea.AAC.1